MRLVLIILLLIPALVKAEEPTLSERLAFVGEKLEVVTIASGRPELPDKAPAVVDVYTHPLITKRGYLNLGEILKDVPGFFTLQNKKENILISRGVPLGSLVMFDGVPLATDVSKGIFSLDEDMNLDYVKRVEVVRGPGSVLWGPDAFSSIVNIVPFSGKDIGGLRFKVLTGTPRSHKGFRFLGGTCLGDLDLMLYGSLSNKKDFSGKNVKRYEEVVSKLSYGNFLELSLKYSNTHLPTEERFQEKKWYSRKDRENYIAKLLIKKDWNRLSFRVKTYWLKNSTKETEDRFSWSYSSQIFYAEAMASAKLFEDRGLLVLGSSLRRNIVNNAVVRIKSFIPEYIGVTDLSPLIEKKDFDTTLKSVFAQYVHRWNQFEWWGGVRYDKHTDYQSSFTYSVGAGWYPSDHWGIKLIYGVAYRTPYAAQFLKRHNMDPERIATASANVFFKGQRAKVDLVVFHSDITKHIGKDPYGGFSKPSDQSINGLELKGQLKLGERASLWTSLTTFHHYGEAEKYRVLKYILYTPSGFTYYYQDYEKPYFTGPNTFASIGFSYKPTDKCYISLIGRYHSSYSSYSIPEATRYRIDAGWSVDAYANYKISDRFSISLKVENLFADKAVSLGDYGLFRTDSARVYVLLNMNF